MSRPRTSSLLLALLVSLATAPVAGCGPSAGAGKGIAASGSGSGNGGPAAPSTKAQIVGNDDDPGGTAAEVFERAKLEMAAGKLAHARTLFDRVVAADRAERNDDGPPSPLGRAAAYNAALCAEQLEESKDARDRFRTLSQLAPDTSDALDALMRRARLDVELDDLADLAAATSAILPRSDLGKGERAESLALQALIMLKEGDLTSAEKQIGKAMAMVDPPEASAADKASGVPPQNAAAVHYAQGELLRAKGNAITFVPVPPDFSAKLEARCQRILDAEAAYIEAIKTKDVKWSVRAGYRVASLYVGLHDDLVVIPAPKSADTDERKALFRGAMRLRYRILLEKGLGTLEHTLNLEKATGVSSVWYGKARDAKATLEKQLQDEKAEIAKLPYTEADLQKALDDLAKKDTKPGKA
jgi:tetratricopeptide (TPR) repeat protein